MKDKAHNLGVLELVKRIAIQTDVVNTIHGVGRNSTAYKCDDFRKIGEQIIRNHYDYLVSLKNDALLSEEDQLAKKIAKKLAARKARVSKIDRKQWKGLTLTILILRILEIQE